MALVDQAAPAAPERRPAEAQVGPAAKRARTEGIEPAALVAAVLRSKIENPTAAAPEPAREMIARWAEMSLGPVPEGEDRGPFHAKFLGMCQEALEDLKNAAQATLAAAVLDVETAEAALSARQGDQKDADEALEKARARTAAAAEHLREEQMTAEQEGSLAVAEEEKQRECLQEFAAVQRQRDEVADMTTGVLPPLVEGSDPAAAEKRIALVEAYLASLKADPTLLSALRGALGRAPSVRGTFDVEAVKEVQAVLAAHFAEIDAALEAKGQVHAEAEAEVMGAKAVLHVARKRASEAASAVAAAEAAVAEAVSAQALAKRALEEQRKVLAVALSTREVRQHSVDEVAQAVAAVTTVKPSVAGGA